MPLIYEPAHEIIVFIAYGSSDRAGEPAHLHSLPRALASLTHKEGDGM